MLNAFISLPETSKGKLIYQLAINQPSTNKLINK